MEGRRGGGGGGFFFFNDTATTEIYTLSLHDALPILYPDSGQRWRVEVCLTLPHETSLRLEKLDSGMPSMVVQGDKVLYVVRSLLPHLVPSVVHFGCHCPINLYDLQLRFKRIGESQGEAISQFSVPIVLEIGSDTLQVS